MAKARQEAEWDRAALIASMWSDQPPEYFHPYRRQQAEQADVIPYNPEILQKIQDSGLAG